MRRPLNTGFTVILWKFMSNPALLEDKQSLYCCSACRSINEMIAMLTHPPLPFPSPIPHPTTATGQYQRLRIMSVTNDHTITKNSVKSDRMARLPYDCCDDSVTAIVDDLLGN